MLHKKIIDKTLKPARVTFSGQVRAGYGNKIYSMLSALIIAILTDSALLIKWKGIDMFIKEPLYMSFKDFNGQDEFDLNYKRNDFFVAYPSNNAWSPVKDMNWLVKTKISTNKRRVLYQNIKPFFFELCSNPIYYEKLNYYNLVRKETIDKALLVAKGNYSNQVKMDEILKVGFEVGGSLLNYFWIPNDELSKLIKFYVDNKFRDHFVIGVQFRTEFLDEKEDTKAFINCAKSLEFEKINDVNFKLKYKSTKWFILSDSQILLNKLKAKYLDKVIVANGSIGHVSFDSNAYFRAILDNELLSRCDELIITGGSTFGFVAAMKRRQMPYEVSGKAKATTCKKATFSTLARRENFVAI